MTDSAMVVEAFIQYGALGIIALIFIVSLRKLMNNMIEMNTHIFEYFMNSNEKTNESLKNSMNSIVQIIQKNTDNILDSKHAILKEINNLDREIQRVEIDKSLLNEILSEQITYRHEINKILNNREKEKENNNNEGIE